MQNGHDMAVRCEMLLVARCQPGRASQALSLIEVHRKGVQAMLAAALASTMHYHEWLICHCKGAQAEALHGMAR
jgi:hypothetical protein